MRWRIEHLLVIIFTGLLGVFKFNFHELWKDEWQAWFDAKDMGLGEMLSFLNYEGHPALWYLYLKLFVPLQSFFEQDELIIQWAHLLLVLVSFYLLFVKLKTPLPIKILYAAGYFLFFEYGLINRSYVFVVLFAFLITYLIQSQKGKKNLLPISLFLICQTEVYGLIIAGALMVYLLYDTEMDLITSTKVQARNLVALAVGVLVFVITVFPRGNEDDFTRAYNQTGFSVESILKSFQGLQSNTFLIGITKDTAAQGYTTFGLVSSVVVFALIFLLFHKRRPILYSWLSGFLVFLFFASFIYTGGVRQWGMLLILFFCLVSLMHLKWERRCIYPLLIVAVFGVFSLVHGVRGLHYDLTGSFTNAKKTGLFLKEKVPIEVPIVGINKFENTPVIGYADRKFYSLPSGEPFSYFRWLEKVYIPSVQELKLFAQFKGVGGLVIVSPRKLEGQAFAELQLWQSFDQANFKQENYYVYSLPVR